MELNAITMRKTHKNAAAAVKRRGRAMNGEVARDNSEPIHHRKTHFYLSF